MLEMPELDATDYKLAFEQFDAWLGVHGPAMTTDQRKAAEYVRLAYDMVRVNKAPAAKERAIKFLADDLAKLEATLAVPQEATGDGITKRHTISGSDAADDDDL